MRGSLNAGLPVSARESGRRREEVTGFPEIGVVAPELGDPVVGDAHYVGGGLRQPGTGLCAGHWTMLVTKMSFAMTETMSWLKPDRRPRNSAARTSSPHRGRHRSRPAGSARTVPGDAVSEHLRMAAMSPSPSRSCASLTRVTLGCSACAGVSWPIGGLRHRCPSQPGSRRARMSTAVSFPRGALSRASWKNGARKTKRATSMMITPAAPGGHVITRIRQLTRQTPAGARRAITSRHG